MSDVAGRRLARPVDAVHWLQGNNFIDLGKLFLKLAKRRNLNCHLEVLLVHDLRKAVDASSLADDDLRSLAAYECAAGSVVSEVSGDGLSFAGSRATTPTASGKASADSDTDS